MGSFVLAGLSLKNLFSKPVTKLYPAEPQVLVDALRGHVENDIENCIFCGLCMKKCPATAIVVDKPQLTWCIDPFSCVQCMACVRVCPKKCLNMMPTYSPVAATMSTITRVQEPKEDKKEA